MVAVVLARPLGGAIDYAVGGPRSAFGQPGNARFGCRTICSKASRLWVYSIVSAMMNLVRLQVYGGAPQPLLLEL
jgi:hypothetical protein